MMPSTRLTTLAPVTPRNLITRTALSSTTRVRSSTAARAAITPAVSSGERARPISSMIEVSAPGPASSGNASGKTETSVLRCASSCSGTVGVRMPERRANTMSVASRKSRIPPAMRKAGRVMPSASSTSSPRNPKTKSNTAAMATARSAVRRLNSSGAPPVRAANTAAVLTGSMMTRSVTKL